MKITVYPTSDYVEDRDIKDKIVVVIDVLRATSTIITALYNGCKEIIPTADIEDAVNISKNYEKDTLSGWRKKCCEDRRLSSVQFSP